MKRLLLPLLAALTLPTAVNAEDYYLVINIGTYTSNTVPMKTLEGCKAALEKAMNSSNWSYLKGNQKPSYLQGICLKSE